MMRCEHKSEVEGVGRRVNRTDGGETVENDLLRHIRLVVKEEAV